MNTHLFLFYSIKLPFDSFNDEIGTGDRPTSEWSGSSGPLVGIFSQWVWKKYNFRQNLTELPRLWSEFTMISLISYLIPQPLHRIYEKRKEKTKKLLINKMINAW